MKIKKVVIQFSPEETLRFLRIMMDADKHEALVFMKDVVKPQVDDATREH